MTLKQLTGLLVLKEITRRKEWTWLMMMQSSGVCYALACIYIGNKWGDSWWQSWAINSDSASTHHNSLDSKTIGRLYMIRHPFHSWWLI